MNKVKKNLGFKFAFFLLLTTYYLLLATSASAWVIGEPIVPCGGTVGTCYFDSLGNGECFGGSNGGNTCQDSSTCATKQPACSQCELLHLVDNLMDFILIAAAPILATVFFIVAGLYIMLGGARPDMLATGKRMFTSALVGIIIVMMAWLVTNTLITTLLNPTLPGIRGGNLPFNSADWWQLNCTDLGLRTDPPGSGGGGGGGGGGTTGLNAINIMTDSVTIVWTTSTPTTSQVFYGPTPAVQLSTPLDTNLVTSHSVTINNLNPNFTYYYRVTTSGATPSFRTLSLPCPNPICITGETESFLAADRITISWTTNSPATTQVRYRANTSNFGAGNNSLAPDPANGSFSTSHIVTILGLSPNTTYWYQVLSVGGPSTNNYPAVGSTGSFITPNVSCTDPVCITGETVTNVAGATSTRTVRVTWTTSTPANSEVRYGPGTSVPLTGPINNSLTTSHSVTISGLNPNFQYWYQVRSRGGPPTNFPAVGSVIGPFTTLP